MFAALFLVSLLSGGLGSPLEFRLRDDGVSPLGKYTRDDPKPLIGKDQLVAGTAWTLVANEDGTPIPGLAESRRMPNEALIVSGKNANVGEQPWMVSVQVVAGVAQHICGGALWKPNKVITAAHCLDYWGTYGYEVALGYYQLSLGDSGNKDSQRIKVISAVPHEEYTGNEAFKNDIAVLTLERDAVITSAVQTIDITKYSTNVLKDHLVHLTGWGRTDGQNSNSGADILQQATFEVLGLEECQSIFGKDIKEQHLCVRHVDKVTSSCQGDSGGPLVWPESFRYYQELVGVVSFGAKGCDPALPQVYQNPAAHKAWLESKL